MLPLYRDPHYTFWFQDDRIISRIHLDDVISGTQVSIFAVDPVSATRGRQLCNAQVGEGGWATLPEPIIVRAGDAFIAVVGPTT